MRLLDAGWLGDVLSLSGVLLSFLNRSALMSNAPRSLRHPVASSSSVAGCSGRKMTTSVLGWRGYWLTDGTCPSNQQYVKQLHSECGFQWRRQLWGTGHMLHLHIQLFNFFWSLQSHTNFELSLQVVASPNKQWQSYWPACFSWNPGKACRAIAVVIV